MTIREIQDKAHELAYIETLGNPSAMDRTWLELVSMCEAYVFENGNSPTAFRRVNKYLK